MTAKGEESLADAMAVASVSSLSAALKAEVVYRAFVLLVAANFSFGENNDDDADDEDDDPDG